MHKLIDSPWHLPSAEVVRLLDVNVSAGLNAEEVESRQQKFGLNRITAPRGTPMWLKFLRQFQQPLVYILLAAAVVTALLGEWVDSSVIFAVVFLNAIIGFLQETKAEKAIDSLSRMVATETSVRRDGLTQRIHSEQLVPGDVVLLHSGDRVPADLRLFHAKNLQVDESSLTGESVPVHKHPDPLALDTVLGDRKNLAFTGTLVTSGQGEGVVWAIADQTETGNIAQLISEAVDLSTPLTKKIAHLSRLLLWGIMTLAAMTIAIGVARGDNLAASFMAAVALAVGAIPEGLPAAVTIVLAIGVSRMAKRRTSCLRSHEVLGGQNIQPNMFANAQTQSDVIRNLFTVHVIGAFPR